MKDEKNAEFWLPLIIVVSLSVVSQLGSLAYSTSQTDKSFLSVLMPSLLILVPITTLLAGIGLKLGRDIGLGTPVLNSVLRKSPGIGMRIVRDAKLAVFTGLVLGGLLVGLRVILADQLPSNLPEFGFRGVYGGLLVSAGAAIAEETWFRLGLMTILVWIFTKLSKRPQPSKIIVWLVLIIIALIFAAVHLPQLTSYGAASPLAIWGTIFGNSISGTLYGWLYWKRGLIAAIIAHFSVDLVIHVLPAIIG